MNIANQKTSDLKAVVKLLFTREKLERRLASVNEKIETSFNGVSRDDLQQAVACVRRRGVKRTLTSSIMQALEASGANGVSVKEIAQTLGEVPQNVYSWFYNAKKTNPNLRKNAVKRWVLVKDSVCS